MLVFLLVLLLLLMLVHFFLAIHVFLLVLTILRHAIFIVLAHSHAQALLLTLIFISIGALSQHNDFVLCLCVLPSAEDQQMGTDSRGSMSESDSRGLTQVLASLPRHCVSRPDLEVVTLLFGSLMLKSGSRGLGPSTEHYNVTA